MNICITADSHFGHSNIIKYCNRNIFLNEKDRTAFQNFGNRWPTKDEELADPSLKYRISQDTIDAMDEAFFDSINRMCGVNDELRHIGDFGFSRDKRRYFETCEKFRKRIRCRNVHLIFGNHDREIIGSLFSSASKQSAVKIAGYDFFFDHSLHAIWPSNHRGVIHLYGHSHSGAEPWADRFMPGRRSMDVGFDNAYRLLGEYRPFEVTEILDIMKDRPGFYMDHHAPKN